MFKTIQQLSKEYHQDTIKLRRDFHKYPEIGWLENRTASLIARYLDNLGYDVLIGKDIMKEESRMGLPSQEEFDKAYKKALEQGADKEYIEHVKDGYTAVAGILRNGDGPCVCLRFDIDALGVYESKYADHIPYKEGFHSLNEGIMHACGHDGHSAIGLTVARVLMDIKDSIQGTIKLVFQPAEEGVMGAKCIADSGFLDNVDYLYAAHILPRINDYDIIPGMNDAFATTKLDVVYHGVSTHAAITPELGNNAILAASNSIINLHAIARNSEGKTRVNVGKVIGGTSRNVIADIAKMELEVRGETTVINEYMENTARNIINASALMYNTSVDIIEMGKAYALECDIDFIDCIRNMFIGTDIKVSEFDFSSLGASDDISYMMASVQNNGGKATYMKLLTDVKASLHNTCYDFNEEILMKGVKIMASIAYYLLKK